jgi:signal transduction histidine kinase
LTLYADKAGRLWVGQLNGDIAVYDIRHSILTTAARSSRTGTITAIHEDTRGNIWVGTTTGLSRLESGQLVSEEIEELASGVLSITEVGRNQLWIATRAGLLRAEVEDTANLPSKSSQVNNVRVYDASDGLPALPVRGYPGVTNTDDGSLLFATANGVARIAPASMPAAKEQPLTPIRIETIVVDDRTQRIEEQAILPPGTSRIEFQYTGLTLAAASRNRFLYKLDGYDPDWVQAGQRREAVYTNLPPGRYRFRVTTRDSGGPREEAAWDFTIRSQFYQTPAFAAISGAIVVLVITAAWRLRLLRLRKQFKMVLSERARIAREIHDTLLQGLFGVGLQIDAIGMQVQSSPEAKQRLDGVRELINKYVRETRSSIWLLRSSSLENKDFPAAIQEAAEALTTGTPVQLDFRMSGRAKPLSTERQEQLLRITHEAIMNVVTHARATMVQVELCFEAESVRIRVSDNGCGFDTERPISGKWGKWGLVGMKERAEQAGAVLKVYSVQGKGTTVESIVPIEAS